MPGPTETNEGTGTALPFSVTLALEHRDGGELWGVLTFAASEPCSLEKYNVSASGGGYFRVMRGDEELPYVGDHKKMSDAEVKLAPDEPLVSEVYLDPLYPFAAGSHSYTVQYVALHFPPPDYEEMVPLRSNIVEVEHEAEEPTTD